MKHYGGKGEGWQLGAPKKAEKRNVSISRREKEQKKKIRRKREDKKEWSREEWTRPVPGQGQ